LLRDPFICCFSKKEAAVHCQGKKKKRGKRKKERKRRGETPTKF